MLNKHASNSEVQRQVADHILRKLAKDRGITWLTDSTRKIELKAPGVMVQIEPDGVALNPRTLVEIYAHIGKLKSGQKKKIAEDLFRLVTISHKHEKWKDAELLMILVDNDTNRSFERCKFLRDAAKLWQINVIVIEPDPTDRELLLSSQDQQATGHHHPKNRKGLP